MKSDVNVNDPRVRRTRQLLLDALCELASERDVRSITVRQIAERATLNRATFYAHFRDKDALMDAAFRGRVQAEMAAKLANAAFTRENLRGLFIVVCDVMDTIVPRCPRSPGENHVLVKTAVQEELYVFILDWMNRTLPKGTSRKFAPEAFAAFLSWALFGASVEWRRGHELSQRVAANQIVDLVSEGLGRAMPNVLKE